MAISDNIQRKQFTAVEELRVLINLTNQHLLEKTSKYSLESPINEKNSSEDILSKNGLPRGCSTIHRLFTFLNQLRYLVRRQEEKILTKEKTRKVHHEGTLVEEIFQNLQKPLNWLNFLKKIPKSC